MANLLDRIVGWIDPHAGLSRHLARQRLQRAYEAASPGDKWKPRRAGASANADHQADAATLRAKSRSITQNVPYIAAAMDALVAATVGTGITPRATGKQAARINKVLRAWMKVCDADGRLDYHGLISLAYRTMERDGEALIRLRPRLATDDLPVPLQLQLLEVDWIDTTKNIAREGAGNATINGIEYDALGRAAAYWLWDSHPGDVSQLRGLRTQSRRVDAKTIIHLYAPDRPGAGRGFPRTASVISSVRDLQLYEDAEIARKNLETRLSVLYSGDATLMGNPSGEEPSTATTVAEGNLGDLPSGSMVRLPTGSNVTVVAPTPAQGYVDFVKFKLHIILAGMGVPYEAGTGDMSQVNFSSARIRQQDFKRNVEQMQWLILIPKLLEPIHRAFIDAGYLGGQFTSRDYSVDFSTPKWAYVNPHQDATADIAEISVGLSSVSEKLRQRGYNPDDVFAEIASDFGKLKDLGVLDLLLFKEKGGAGPADPAAQDQAATQDAAAADTARAISALRAEIQALGGKAAPTVDFGDAVIHVTRTETLPPAVVHVHAAEQPAPVVNVNVPEAREQPAPVVNVSNTVQPAKVDVAVKLPKRSTESIVEYNAKGDIVRTLTVEKDAPGG